MIEVVKARASHLRSIAARMRQADRDEISAATGMSPLSALSFSLRHSRDAYVVLLNGQPEMIFGVGDINLLGRVGAPWLLGTDRIWLIRHQFLRHSRHWLRQLFSHYTLLHNVVDCRNSQSIRWLGWLGFRFTAPFDINGNPFMLFEMRADECVS